MKHPTNLLGTKSGTPIAILACVASMGGCQSTGPFPSSEEVSSSVTIESPAGVRKPPFQFSAEDSAFLDEVQRGCFNFVWNAANAKTGMVPDRTSGPTVSTAGVGFELAAIPVGVERGWITREQGRERATLVLDMLARDASIRHEGLFQHFIDGDTAGPHTNPELEHVVSTVDSAWLLAGVIVASEYFGGELKMKGDALVEGANWKAFVSGKEAKPSERGFVSLGWKTNDKAASSGPGKYLPYYWVDAGAEHRMVTFLAVCGPNERYRVDPETYYRLRRQLGEYPGVERFAWFPWSGAMFAYTFADLFLDYSSIGPDTPSSLEVTHRPRIDWWENSRRVTKFQQIRAVEEAARFPTFGENSWGLTASDCVGGYQVPGVFPKLVKFKDDRVKWDYDAFVPKDDFGDGSMAPYGAGCSIMFDPQASIRAMRHYRGLTDGSGQPLAWRDPANGGYGFVDAFRVAAEGQPAWAAKDVLAIDQGPMILAIENARTGLVWRLFHEHPYVRAGLERLKLKRVEK